MANEKEIIQDGAENDAPLSQEEKEKAVSSELSLIPAADKKEVEKVIKTEDVLTINKHKTKVSSFKRRFPASKFEFKGFDPEDPENKKLYEKALEAWREMKNWRTKVFVPDVKALKEPYRKLLDFYIAATGPVEAELKKLELAPGDFVDKWEAAEKDFKQKEAKDLEERTNKRVNDLGTAGAVFDGEYYSIGSEEFGVKQISLGLADINAMPDNSFELVLEQITAGAKIIAEKEQEKKDEAERKANEEKENMENEKKQLQAGRIELRGELSEAAGMTFNLDRDGYEYQNLFVSTDNIKEFDKAQWDAFFSTIKTQIQSIKNAAKEKEEKAKRLVSRPKDLLAIGMEYNKGRNRYFYYEVEVSDHFLETATDGGWEECIEDAKAKIETIKARIAQEETRHNEILALGYSFENNFYWYKGVRFDVSSFIKQDAVGWAKTIEYLKKQPAGIDAAIKLQNERYALLAPYATFGEQVEMKKLFELSAERFDELLTSKKAAYDKKIADDLELAETNKNKLAAENLAKSSDAVKFQHVIDNLPAIPEMQSEEFKKIAEIISKKYDEIRALKK